MPVADPTVATLGLPLVHVPPVVASVKVVVLLKHTVLVPAIADTDMGLTVTVVSEKHLVKLSVYVMIAVPAETPFTLPS
jgi:hypothetical protein